MDTALVHQLIASTGWPEPHWVDTTTSTNSDARAALPVASGSVFGADEQRAGRGRLGREWVSEPKAGLWFTLVLDPLPGPLALVVGLGVARGLAPWCAVGLKWPNDVLVGDRKLAGMLIEVEQQSLVGIGINLRTPAVPSAIGLADVTAAPWTPEEVLASVLQELHDVITRFQVTPVQILDAYRARCVTLGRTVQVHLPDGSTLAGKAIALDDDGHLVVEVGDFCHTVAAGDVIHATI